MYYLQHMCCIPEVNKGSVFDNAIIKISRPELEKDFLFSPRRFPDMKKMLQTDSMCYLFFSLLFFHFHAVSQQIHAVSQLRCWCNSRHYNQQVSPNTALSADLYTTSFCLTQETNLEVYIKRRAGVMLIIHRQEITSPTYWVIWADVKNCTN